MFKIFEIKEIKKGNKIRGALNGGAGGGVLFRRKEDLVKVSGKKNGEVIKRGKNISQVSGLFSR